MERHCKHQLGLFCVMLLSLAPCTSQDFTPSRATYYGSPDCYGTPRGACGYGEYGRIVNDGSVSGVSGLWRNGSGCGGCYQVRCKNPQYCDDYGSYVVATDYGEGDRTDFVMSPRAYSRLGRNPDASAQLFKYGVVDVEFRRISCNYNSVNIIIRIHENSRYPDYLAIVVLYVGGQFDVTSVEMWQEDRREWKPMRRAFGAVFDSMYPSGPIFVRLRVIGTAGDYWAESKNAIPNDWKVGDAYDTQIQLH